MVKKLQYFILLAGLVITGMAFTFLYKGGANAIKIIVIDPGHGGKDPGCSGAIHKEKEVSLAVALKLGKYIEENFKDVKVIYTRTTDIFVELEDRAQIANKAKADLFISIHCNAAGKPVMIKDPKTGKKRPKVYKNKKGKLVVVEKPNPVPFGTETYVMGLKNEEGKMKVATRENSAIFYEDDYEKKYGGFDPESQESYIIMSNYTSAYVIQSASLAMKMQEEYGKKAGRIDKGVHRQSIWVLWRTSMPSILTEIGYLTNPLEEIFLGSAKGQEYLAKAMFRGLRKYKDEVEGKKKEYNDEFENQVALENENVKAGNLPGVKKVSEEDDDDLDSQKSSAVAESEVKDTGKEDLPVKTPDPVLKVEVTKPEALENKSKPVVKEQEVKTTQQDTLKAVVIKADTVISASAIAEKFRKETKPAAAEPKKEEVSTEKKEQEAKRAEVEKKKEALKVEKTELTPRPEPKKETAVAGKKELEAKLLEIKKKEDALKNEIVFKVQFATSDIALNLKQEKFASITDADFYRLNNTLKYTSGKFDTVKDALVHQTYLREKGFKDCFVIALKGGQRMDLAEARKATGQ